MTFAANDWPMWLERQLLGTRLSELIDELELISPAEGPGPTLDELIGEQWQALLSRGLSALEFDRLRQLIRNPQLLLELQEQVFINGGNYWQDLPVDEDVRSTADTVAKRVKAAIYSSGETAVTPANQGISFSSPNRRLYVIFATLAASVLVAVGIRSLFLSEPSVAFAWEHPDSLDSSLSATEYGETLSKSLEEWWANDPAESREELLNRLRRFRDGCETLVDARHPQLTGDQREQLVTKCKKWQVKIEQNLADVEKTNVKLVTIKQNSDKTIQATADALRQLF
jgi:hypothetical protein